MSELDAAGWERLHQLRVRGMLPAGEYDDALTAAIVDAGLAAKRGRFLMLTADGKATHAAWARLASGSDEEAVTRAAYDAFLPLNRELLEACTAWQVRPDNTPNDHTDADYDRRAIDGLASVDERVDPVLAPLGQSVRRFAQYRGRLADALRKVRAGDGEWFASPRVDSYHTVWMQLHEDLLVALGLDRGAEEELS